jgi:RimJ/RimL family protein N-acetyltransferase
MTRLRTERLLLRPLEPDDAEAYAAMRYHPKVAEWLAVEDTGSVEAARHAIVRFADRWRERGYAPWGLFVGDRLIGHGGLNFLAVFDGTEVLWALHPDFWHQGYASEMARAALAFGFETLGLPLIFAISKPDNLASRAVMERLGLGYRKDVTYKNIDAVWFDITREVWRSRRSTG